MRNAAATALALALFALTLSFPARAAQGTVAQGETLLQADSVDYDMEKSVVTARGHVEIDEQGRMLMADEVSYDQKTDTVVATGHVSVLDEKGNVAFANRVTLTDKLRDGALQGFGALVGKNGRLAASSAQRVGGQYTIANHAAYTPCKICVETGDRTPTWQVNASRIVYDEVRHKIRFRDAVVRVLGVPLIYMPFLSEPDPSVKHATGLLTPEFGSSTQIGYFIRLPYYISLSPSDDLTLAPLFSTRGGELLETEYRERWDNGGFWLQGSAANNPNGGLSGDQNQSYAHLFGSGRLDVSEHWQTGFDVQYSSNDTYLKRYDISLLDRLTTDFFIDGEQGRSRFAITGYYFEGLRATDKADVIPYILPLIQYTLIPDHKIAAGQVRFDINSAVINRTLGPTSQRVTGELRWRAPFITGDGQVFTLLADARGDVYHVDNDDIVDFASVPASSRFVSRGVPYFAIDWEWPFAASAGQGRSVVVSPLAEVIAQPYGGNPRGLFPEDSFDFELNEDNLFSLNSLPGYDLVESGPRANIGFRGSVLFGRGAIETVWGQTYRIKPDPVFGTGSGEHGTVSDIVGRVSVKFLPYIDLTDRIDLDRADGTVRRHEVYMTGTYHRSSIEISYVQLPPEAAPLGLPQRKEVNAQADVNFYENWQVFGAVRRDLVANKLLDTEFGLGYEDECLGVAVAYRRKFTSDRDLPPSTAIVLRFSLKTTEKPIEPFSLFPRDVFAHP